MWHPAIYAGLHCHTVLRDHDSYCMEHLPMSTEANVYNFQGTACCELIWPAWFGLFLWICTYQAHSLSLLVNMLMTRFVIVAKRGLSSQQVLKRGLETATHQRSSPSNPKQFYGFILALEHSLFAYISDNMLNLWPFIIRWQLLSRAFLSPALRCCPLCGEILVSASSGVWSSWRLLTQVVSVVTLTSLLN